MFGSLCLWSRGISWVSVSEVVVGLFKAAEGISESYIKVGEDKDRIKVNENRIYMVDIYVEFTEEIQKNSWNMRGLEELYA